MPDWMSKVISVVGGQGSVPKKNLIGSVREVKLLLNRHARCSSQSRGVAWTQARCLPGGAASILAEEAVVIAASLMARHLDDRVPIPAKIPNFVQPGKSARDQGVFHIAFGV